MQTRKFITLTEDEFRGMIVEEIANRMTNIEVARKVASGKELSKGLSDLFQFSNGHAFEWSIETIINFDHETNCLESIGAKIFSSHEIEQLDGILIYTKDHGIKVWWLCEDEKGELYKDYVAREEKNKKNT